MPKMSPFTERYPLKLRYACLQPSLERVLASHHGHEFPWPLQQKAESFLCFCGYSQSSIRTALSRSKSKAELVLSATDSKRLTAGELLDQYTQLFLSEPFRPGEFTLLLFHFATDQTRERAQLKELLAQFNFRMLTQNAYLNYGARNAEIQAFFEQQGFAEHIYCFQNLPELPERLILELPEIYELPVWSARLAQASKDFEEYLALPGTLQERYWRYIYARASFHTNLLTVAPYLPERYFPEVRLTEAIFTRFNQLQQEPEFIQAYQESFL